MLLYYLVALLSRLKMHLMPQKSAYSDLMFSLYSNVSSPKFFNLPTSYHLKLKNIHDMDVILLYSRLIQNHCIRKKRF